MRWTELNTAGPQPQEMRITGTTEAQLRRALKDVPPTMLPNGITGGDTKLIWSSTNPDEVETAQRMFDNLKQKGFAIFDVLGDGGKGERVTSFNPNAKMLIAVPPLRGGC